MNLDAWEKLAAEALERAEAATKAPWTAGVGRRTMQNEIEVLAPDGSEVATFWPEDQQANAEFAAHARSVVPELAAALREATEEIRRLRALPAPGASVKVTETVGRLSGVDYEGSWIQGSVGHETLTMDDIVPENAGRGRYRIRVEFTPEVPDDESTWVPDGPPNSGRTHEYGHAPGCLPGATPRDEWACVPGCPQLEST